MGGEKKDGVTDERFRTSRTSGTGVCQSRRDAPNTDELREEYSLRTGSHVRIYAQDRSRQRHKTVAFPFVPCSFARRKVAVREPSAIRQQQSARWAICPPRRTSQKGDVRLLWRDSVGATLSSEFARTTLEDWPDTLLLAVATWCRSRRNGSERWETLLLPTSSRET